MEAGKICGLCNLDEESYRNRTYKGGTLRLSVERKVGTYTPKSRKEYPLYLQKMIWAKGLQIISIGLLHRNEIFCPLKQNEMKAKQVRRWYKGRPDSVKPGFEKIDDFSKRSTIKAHGDGI